MPRDLFGEVTRPSISIGDRKWYTVPVSLLTHTLAISAVIVLPLMAAPLFPHVISDGPMVTLITTMPTPPAPPKPRMESKPVENLNAAPVEAPTGVAKEPEILSDPVSDTPGIVGGAENIEHVLVAPPPAPQPAPPPKPLQVGGAVRRPMQVKSVQPVYPAIAQAARVQGIVIIEATIGQDGRVANMRVLRSIPLLDQAAMDAVAQWEYTPTLLNGTPVPVIMTVTVNFTLK